MSYENGTTHYNLPQTVGSDKRDWFDSNEAFANVDAALHTAYEVSDNAASDITTIKSTILDLQSTDTTLRNDIDTNTGNISTLNTSVTNLSNTVSDNKQDLMDSICSIVEQSATATYAHAVGEFFWYNDTLYKATLAIAVGDTIVPNTNCDTTNVTTELLAQGGVVVDAASVTYSNTTSGLTATNVQSAIDEVSEAENISFDDTLASIGASDVQSAIVALKTLIDSIGGNSMFPTLNYSSPAHSFGSSTSYTVPSDDNTYYLSGSTTVTNSGSTSISINGVTVGAGSTVNGGEGKAFVPLLKLSAGDVVSCSPASGALHVFKEA